MIKPLTVVFILCCFSKPSQALELLDFNHQIIGQELLVTPQFEIAVSQKVIDAIDNGIVITFVFQAKTYQSKDWWFDEIIESKLQTFKVRYFSLFNEYQLHQVKDKEDLSFVTLNQLLQQLGQKTTFTFNAKRTVDYLETRIFLDKQALPSIMQLPNVFDADWNFNSDWQQVPLTVSAGSTQKP